MFHVNLPVCKSDWIEWIQLKPSETLVFHIPAQQVFWVFFLRGPKIPSDTGAWKPTENERMDVQKMMGLGKGDSPAPFLVYLCAHSGVYVLWVELCYWGWSFLWIKELKINAWAGGFFCVGSPCMVCEFPFTYCFSSIFCRRKWGKTRGVVSSDFCGEMIQFDEHIYQMGWFNHQLAKVRSDFPTLLELPSSTQTAWNLKKKRLRFPCPTAKCTTSWIWF